MRVHQGCPICRGDVLGTMETGFYCKHCNLIFTKRHILFEEGRSEIRSLIDKHFGGYERLAEPGHERRRQQDELDRASERLAKHVEQVRRTIPKLAQAAHAVEAVDWGAISAVSATDEEAEPKQPVRAPRAEPLTGSERAPPAKRRARARQVKPAKRHAKASPNRSDAKSGEGRRGLESLF